MSDLVSQAEEEGITLAEVISRTMTKKEMDRAQKKINTELAENYGRIGDFMSGISVPSIEEIMESGFGGFGVDFVAELPVSDDPELIIA